MDVPKCQSCHKPNPQATSICNACLAKQKEQETPLHEFFLKQQHPRRRFIGSMAGVLTGLLAASWRFFHTNATPALSAPSAPLRLDFASGDLSFWNAEGAAFLNQPI